MHRKAIQYKLKQQGLSLIELMIAMLVGLILIGGVLSIFISSRQSYGVNSGVARIQESGRFALSFITKPVRMAGYMGCGLSSSNFANDLKSPANTDLAFNFKDGIVGFEYTGTAPGNTYNIASDQPSPTVGTGNWSPSLDASLQNLVIPGTDVMVLRISQIGDIAGYVDPGQPPNGAQFWVTANPGIQAGDLMVISNCVNTIVVQASQVNGVGNGHIVVNTGNTYQPGNAVAGIPDTMVGASVMSVGSVVFYIGQGADGSPALFEAITDTNNANGFLSQELVPGVENMQILYGVDTTGSQVPSQYVTANNVANWDQVVSVRVSLLMRSETGAVPIPSAAQPFTLDDTTINAPLDTRLRQVFTTTIGLRNRLP